MYMGGKEGKLGGLMGEMKQVRMVYRRKRDWGGRDPMRK